MNGLLTRWPFLTWKDRLLIDINRKVNLIMATQIQTAADVNALTVQVGKILDEVSDAADALRTRIAELEEQLANATTDTVPVLEEAVAGLKSVLQTLDDLNPDLPVG